MPGVKAPTSRQPWLSSTGAISAMRGREELMLAPDELDRDVQVHRCVIGHALIPI